MAAGKPEPEVTSAAPFPASTGSRATRTRGAAYTRRGASFSPGVVAERVTPPVLVPSARHRLSLAVMTEGGGVGQVTTGAVPSGEVPQALGPARPAWGLLSGRHVARGCARPGEEPPCGFCEGEGFSLWEPGRPSRGCHCLCLRCACGLCPLPPTLHARRQLNQPQGDEPGALWADGPRGRRRGASSVDRPHSDSSAGSVLVTTFGLSFPSLPAMPLVVCWPPCEGTRPCRQGLSGVAWPWGW